jgi:UDP-N-acetylmuramate--alanine ligase
MLFDKRWPIHFMGIGGISMAPLTLLYRQLGYCVQGSDSSENNNYVPLLKNLGVKVFLGHQASNLDGIQQIVYSSAIKPGFAEFDRANEDPSIKIVHRSEAVWDLFGTKKTLVAVTGSHGKTSTTAMLAGILQASSSKFSDPGFLIGARMSTDNDWTQNAQFGNSDIAVIEADESDASFLNYRPTYAVITSIEVDHLDRFGNREHFDQAFMDFMAKVEVMNFLCQDDPGVRRLLPKIEQAQIPYRFYSLDDLPEQLRSGSRLDELHFFGEHNFLNAAGACSAARQLGIDDLAIEKGLMAYRLPQRRLQYLGKFNGVDLVDDYAHHPSEIAVTLRAVRQRFNSGRVLVVFQPHLYSRTRFFAEEFARALEVADEVIVTGIYAAREQDPGDIDASTIAKLNPRFASFEDKVQAAAYVRNLACPGDVIVVMGAGDIWQIIPQLQN